MIDVLDKWMLESTSHFNTIAAITMILYVGSWIALFIIGKRFGKPDERTNGIYLKITSCMFLTQLIMNGLFITFIERDIEYFRQFFLLFQGIVFLVGAVYAFGLYRKEYK
jgi:hypothetical protein